MRRGAREKPTSGVVAARTFAKLTMPASPIRRVVSSISSTIRKLIIWRTVSLIFSRSAAAG
jgi:hypothetical protein